MNGAQLDVLVSLFLQKSEVLVLRNYATCGALPRRDGVVAKERIVPHVPEANGETADALVGQAGASQPLEGVGIKEPPLYAY